jgi:threonine/homoserine/homoserine lactone efflux protein
MGGLYIIYLAYNAYKNWKTLDTKKKLETAVFQNFFKAVLVNLLNPNPYLGWSLVMGPILIKAWISSPANGIILLTGFYGSMIVYSIAMIALFASTRNLGSKVTKISIGISVIALAIFGVYLLWSGICAF